MPHLHGNKATDKDAASDVSGCSTKNISTDHDDTDCMVKDAESAANKLLSLAALAEEHGKSSVDVAAAKDEHNRIPSNADLSTPPSPPSLHPTHQHHLEEGRDVPSLNPGMGPPWRMVGHPPRYPGFFRQPGMHPVFPPGLPGAPSASSPIPAEHSPRFIRRGAPPRGGFPMWAGPPPPRPPYHPHPPHAVGPSALPPHFRRPVVPPVYITRHISAGEDDVVAAVTERVTPAPKRVSLGYPPKSILKKPRLDPHAVAVSPEVCEDYAAVAEPEATAAPKPRRSSLEALAESAAAIREASQRPNAQEAAEEEMPVKSTIDSAVIVEKTASSLSEDGSTSMKNKRIISPASSNEYPKADYDDDMSYSVEGSLSPEHSRLVRHASEGMVGSPHRPYHSPGGPFRIGLRPPLPPMRAGPHGPPGPYMAYPPPPHALRPFPAAGMPSPLNGPSIYHARNMSARGRPAFAAVPPPFYGRTRMDSPAPATTSFSPEQQRVKHGFDKGQPAASAPSPPVPTSSSRKSPSAAVLEPSSDVAGNGTRCIPLNPPIPSKYWSEAEINKEVILPDFHRLVNFPDLLIKGRNANGGDGEGGSANGKKRCVMCGQLRVSATYVRAKKANAESAAATAAAASEDASAAGGAAATDSGSNHIIPRQNKGVCTACDVTVWVALELDGMEIKWCKGCKNFRPWSHFGDKSLATKCLRCRDRQKEKYALQKSANRRRSSASSMESDSVGGGGGGGEEKKTGDANDMHCSLAVVAANGLRNLMKAV